MMAVSAETIMVIGIVLVVVGAIGAFIGVLYRIRAYYIQREIERNRQDRRGGRS
jgi:beta-lactamase regulating signal transducer with metallopeptidase domain